MLMEHLQQVLQVVQLLQLQLYQLIFFLLQAVGLEEITVAVEVVAEAMFIVLQLF